MFTYFGDKFLVSTCTCGLKTSFVVGVNKWGHERFGLCLIAALWCFNFIQTRSPLWHHDQIYNFPDDFRRIRFCVKIEKLQESSDHHFLSEAESSQVVALMLLIPCLSRPNQRPDSRRLRFTKILLFTNYSTTKIFLEILKH